MEEDDLALTGKELDNLSDEELDEKLLSNCKIFHFGSLSLTNEPSRSATLEAVSIAKKAGVIISYDPNYRASLWKSECTAVEEMKKVISLADIMKVSDEESLLLTGASNSSFLSIVSAPCFLAKEKLRSPLSSSSTNAIVVKYSVSSNTALVSIPSFFSVSFRK